MGAPSQAWRPLSPIGTMPPTPDPYATLGLSPSATDAELRAAYRRLVQLHHPDHNGGSAESARRFEAGQGAYAAGRRRPRGAPGGGGGGGGGGRRRRAPPRGGGRTAPQWSASTRAG